MKKTLLILCLTLLCAAPARAALAPSPWAEEEVRAAADSALLSDYIAAQDGYQSPVTRRGFSEQIALTLALVTVGRAALEFVNRFIIVPPSFIDLWADLRFLIMGGIMFAAVGLLYAAAQDVRQPVKNIVPGVLAALMGWMVVSAAFSFYVENFANYTVIYGTLGTVIVLMMWLNLTAVMLIMGAEINGVLISIRGRRTTRNKTAAHEK